MDTSFARALDDWTAYYALMGGAAATLLGLLFVAVSLRLNIFHQREVADVRDYAALTLGTFLVAIIVAGVALAPHDHPRMLAPALFALGVVGFLGVVWVVRISIALNRVTAALTAASPSRLWRGWPYALFVTCPYGAVIGAALLLWMGHGNALGWLAITEGWLLVSGTVVAWILLSHAGRAGADPAASGPPPS